jgi:predicted MFS family arabinose efflux permease
MSTSSQAESAQPSRAQTLTVLAGASILMSLGMGMRQSLGLFMVPITRDLSLTVSDYTFALAVQNIVWGFTQPFIGAVSDRIGIKPLMIAGTLCYAAGIAVTIYATGSLTLILGAGIFIGLALSCTASNLSLSATARMVSAASRSTVLGAVAAIGSFGTFMVAPLAQRLITDHGWQAALVLFLALAAIMFPAAFMTGSVDRVPYPKGPNAPGSDTPATLSGVLRSASRHRGYVTMSVAFFVCGLQLVFLTTHLPTYLALCGQDPMLSAQALATIGMFNVVGCYLLGWLGGRYPKHILLGLVYVLRSIAITAYFVLPPTPFTTLLFAAVMGMLWLGVAPLVQGLVAQMFGLRFMATLSGLAFASHQVGSFLGAWGGGLVYDAFGSYDHAWQFGVVIGLIAGCAQMLTNDQPSRPMLREASA